MSWCLAFPFCPNEPIRAEAWQIVTAFYDLHFPDIPKLVHSATAQGERFLRARTRNELVRMADRFDIVVLVDADTLIHPDGIRRMVEWVNGGNMRLGKPFHRGTNLPLDQQQQVATGRRQWPDARFNDPGAAWAIRPADWWTAGGMDEHFQAWGGEDDAFNYLFAAMGGATEFDQHAAVKTDHPLPRWRADPDWAQTWEREAVTRHIYRNPHLAHEWLTVRHQPGITTQWITRHNINLQRRLTGP